MNAKRLSLLLLGLCLSLSMAEQASAYYAAHMGRWLTRDPAGYAAGPNLYLYVFGSPVQFVDPSGLAPPGDAPPWTYPGGEITREDFNEWAERFGLPGDRLDLGCIGLCSAFQGRDSSGKYPKRPEDYPGTACYFTEEEAVAKCNDCEEGKEPFVFSKQGRWNTGGFATRPKPPKPRDDGTIPPGSISNLEGHYNYVCRFPREGDGPIYGWGNHGVHLPRQTFTFEDFCPRFDGYPNEMWCCTCRDECPTEQTK